MITITKQNDGVLFTFENSDKYLYGNGSILVPFNTLSIVADKSDMITLKKAASNDVFISARYDTDFGYRSKDDAIEDLKDLLFAETGGGGSESGITSGDVQTMIDASLDDYYDKDEVDSGFSTVNTAIAGKADTSAVTAVANDVSALSGQVATKVDASDFNAYSAATDARLAEDEEVTAAALNDLQENKADTSAVTAAIDAAISGKADTSAVTAAIDDAKAYYISFATLATVGIHDEDWDDIVAAIDDHRPIYAGYPRTDGGIIYYGVECMNKNVSNTEIVMTASDNSAHYFYTFTKNGSNDYSYTVSTKPYVPDITTSITSGSTDAQVPSAKATYDAITAATTGGGATYSAGTNISIDTGNTISCTLPISAGTGQYSLSIGNIEYGVSQVSGNYAVSVNGGGFHPNTARGVNSFAANLDNQALGEGSFANGQSCIANGKYSHSEGQYTKTMNTWEHSQGMYNVSNTGSTNADKTLFSVGNGTSEQARHNAFEIRQNGDIFITSGNTDIKLQDHLGGGGGSVTVDPTLDTGSTNPVANSAITQALENKLDASAYTPTDLSEYWTSAQTQSAIDGVNNALTAHTANTTVHVTSVEKDAWNAKANIDHVTQSEYDAMVTAGTLDSNTMYIIDDAVPFDPSTKVDTSAITSSITSGSTDSEIPTAKAVYDAIPTGGGATYSAGRNISIDTANTINCTLPITGNNSSIIMTGASNSITDNNRFSQVFGTGNTVNAYGGYSQYCITVEGINNSCGTQATHVEGGYNQGIYGSYSHVEGAHNKLEISISPYDEVCSHVEGKYNKVLNYSEHASGQYNNSVSVSTTFGDGGNTLFSVGNGTSDSARHNAFEIRQNGDIYVNDGTNDVRLQDTILALGGLKLVKLTQAEYDALVSGGTVDSSTIYFITNVVS